MTRILEHTGTNCLALKTPTRCEAVGGAPTQTCADQRKIGPNLRCPAKRLG